MQTAPDPAPDQEASAEALLAYAESYRAAATTLLTSDGRDPLAAAPARYCALHAIELYLDAFLRGLGESPGRLRAHGHDLRVRAALAIARGLTLRRKTAQHLVRLSVERAHQIARYGPARPEPASETNRLAATLDEIARKVGDAIRRPGDAAA